MTNIARKLILTLIASTAALASAQQMPPHSPVPGHPPVPMSAAAQQVTVTYFDKDPRGSSRALGTVRVQLPGGEHRGGMRRALKQHAPKGATFARITMQGHAMIIPLNSDGHHHGPADHQPPMTPGHN